MTTEREEAWQLPETLSGHPGVRLASRINGQADQLTDGELSRVHFGVQETVRRVLDTENPLAEAWGLSFERFEDNPNAYKFTHQGSELQTPVHGTVIWESGDYINAEFVLIDASRVEQTNP